MAYKIQYTPQDERRYPPFKQRSQKNKRWVWPLLILALAALWITGNGLPDFLIPGDPDITRAAAAEMVSLVKEGVAVQDAVVVFCQEIFDVATL